VLGVSVQRDGIRCGVPLPLPAKFAAFWAMPGMQYRDSTPLLYLPSSRGRWASARDRGLLFIPLRRERTATLRFQDITRNRGHTITLHPYRCVWTISSPRTWTFVVLCLPARYGTASTLGSAFLPYARKLFWRVQSAGRRQRRVYNTGIAGYAITSDTFCVFINAAAFSASPGGTVGFRRTRL